jgi:hypothetical protein
MIKPSQNNQENNNPKNNNPDYDVKKLYFDVIDNIYNSPEKFINELEYPTLKTDNEQTTYNWPQLDNIINKSNNKQYNKNREEEYNKLKKELVGYMMVKDNIADYLWVAILSTITILVSQNQILSSVCNTSDTNINDTEFNTYLDSMLNENN